MSAGNTLRHTLVVRHPESDAPVALLVGEPVPEWATGLVGAEDYEPGESEGATGGRGDVVDEDDLAASTVPMLRKYAEEQGFDLGEATKKVDVIAAIKAATEARSAGNGSGTD